MKIGNKRVVRLGAAMLMLLVLSIGDECQAEQKRMNINAVACKTKDGTMQVNRWLSEGDREAAASEIINGNCQMLERGSSIFVEKHGIEWAKVRLRGSNVPVWTLEKFLN